jgi:threonine dehydratase
VIVPDHAPRTKIDAIRRLGGEVVAVPFDEWWQVIVRHEYPGEEGFFLHPVSDPAVIAGNATVGLEIAEQLPEVEAVLVPFGGGGLSCGIATALSHLKPGVPVYGCEVETAAPLAAAWRAGEPTTVEYTPTFVDGIGSTRVLDEMWPLARRRLAGPRVVSVEAVADAVRLLVERVRIVAEGAGAAPVAAALAPTRQGEPALPKKVVCVVSGGNLDVEKLLEILRDRP